MDDEGRPRVAVSSRYGTAPIGATVFSQQPGIYLARSSATLGGAKVPDRLGDTTQVAFFTWPRRLSEPGCTTPYLSQTSCISLSLPREGDPASCYTRSTPMDLPIPFVKCLVAREVREE